jgi:hypothetical protein
MTTGYRVGVRAKRRQTVELFHDFFKFVFSLLKIQVKADDGILPCEFDNLFTIKVVQ